MRRRLRWNAIAENGEFRLTSVTNRDASTTQLALPPEGVRTTLTILILLHLFALATAVLSNAGPVSQLRAGLKRVPFVEAYLQFLHMDLAYNYQFVSRDVVDDVVWLEIDVAAAVSASEGSTTTIRLPDPALSPGIRRQRLRNVVREMVTLAASGDVDPNDVAVLPTALAEGLLKQAGVSAGTHRLRLMRQSPRELAVVQELSTPPQPETVYEANLLFDGREIGLIPVVSEEQRSRVRRP